MHIQPISFLNLDKYSPWPRRILGLEEWQVQNRNKQKISKEYDNDTYKLALTLWEEGFSQLPAVRPMQFYHQLEKLKAKEVLANKKVYGKTEDLQLISIKDELFLTDYKTACSLHYQTISNILSDLLTEANISQVIEPGCGNGVNLFYLNERIPLQQAIGGEISANAVKLGNDIAAKCQTPIQFHTFDYFNVQDLIKLSSLLTGDYVLFTCHSIEQVSIEESNFINNIVNLKNPPRFVVHFEPILDHEDTNAHSALAIRYSAINGYNQDLLTIIRQFETKGVINVTRFEKRIFGINAFNPTSLLIWQPSNRA